MSEEPKIKTKEEVQKKEVKRANTLPMIEKGMTSLVDLIAPSSVEVDFKYIRVGEKFLRSFFVVGYPRYVSPGWLQPLIDFDHQMDIAMFIYPASSPDILSDLKRKIAEMEATISSEVEAGQIVDPKVSAALEDALALQEELAKGVERFFQFGLYITLSAPSLGELEEASKSLISTLAGILVLAKTATLQMEDGFKTTLPYGQDRLYLTRNMDTTSLASTFPFISATLTQDKGVMYGVNEQNGSLIIFDRFSLENANEVILGKSGAGKSYLLKLEIMRQFVFGTEVIVVDPEGEYGKIAAFLGGEEVAFTHASPIKINPFDLSGLYEEGENELGLKILSLHALLRIIMGNLNPAQDAMLDRALVETYRQKGITTDPSTQKLEPPLMEDLYKTLLGTEDPVARELALHLEKFIKGSLAGIFNQQSNFDIKNPFTVFSIKNLEEELRPVAMHVILDFVWTKIRKTLKKRLLVLDEAWYMMKYEDSASFVYSIAKRARKYYLGLTTATQDVEDFMKTDYGKAILSNSSIQILLKQGPSEVDLIAKTFYLSEGEKGLLLSADVGEGLFFAGQNHVAIKAVAAPFEHEIITSNPQELIKQREQAQAPAAESSPIASSPEPSPLISSTPPTQPDSPQPTGEPPPKTEQPKPSF
jgi:conjugal transfer ATP-binding protein TraC